MSGTQLTFYILAQVFGVITLAMEFASYQIKNQRKYLLVTSIASMNWTLMFVFIGLASGDATQQVTPIIAAAFGVIRGMIFWIIFAYNTKKAKIIGKCFLYAFLAIAVVAGVMGIMRIYNGPNPHTTWIHIIGFPTALFFIIAQYLPSKHYVRVAVVLYAAAMMLTQTPLNIYPTVENPDMFRWNIMGIVIESSKIISVIVFYVLWYRKSALAKKLALVKEALACEVKSITEASSIEEIADIVPVEKIQKLASQMVRLELSIVNTEEITDIDKAKEHTKDVIADMETVSDVKALLEKVVNARHERLANMPNPRIDIRKGEL